MCPNLGLVPGTAEGPTNEFDEYLTRGLVWGGRFDECAGVRLASRFMWAYVSLLNVHRVFGALRPLREPLWGLRGACGLVGRELSH